ncbi:MAG: Serine/threonine-protein kinase pkn1 [Nitrospira sp.]|nr:Serine/threonine-protein kinase pkn1 [Nitrospira sp.]
MRILTSLVFILLCARIALWGATPVATTLLLAGSEGVQLSWNVIPGRTYLIQSTTNLSVPWQDALPAPSTLTSAANLISQNFPSDLLVRFFRVQLVDTNANPAPIGMALIPAGSFEMGDTFSESESNELPVHTVFVSTFYMDKTEVTKRLWDEVKEWNGGNGYTFDNPGAGKAANHPVQIVSWYDVVKWCNARSEKEGRVAAYYSDAALTQVYKKGQVAPYVKWDTGYRLPTEAEWEKAARGGASGHRFPWSDADTITHSRANYYSTSDYSYDISSTRDWIPTYWVGDSPYTSPVGSFAANGYGLYDMGGNVWEWCWDWYDRYSSGSQSDPRGPSSSSSPFSRRVIRGGSWYYDAFYCRSALRFIGNPEYRSSGYGFRSVLPPGQF